jgi:HAD superfamily hydrolase (TIGR01548 family)
MDRILVFDVDGVLVEVGDSYRATIGKTIGSFTGRLVTPELIQDFKNQGGWNNDWDLCHKLINDYGVSATYQQVVDRFNGFFFGVDGEEGLIYRERWIPKDGALERLARRYQFALFTGRVEAELKITLDRFTRGLAFDPIITADAITNPKPAPDGLLRIAELHPGKKLFYVGDTVDDARSAKAAGVPFYGIAAPSSVRYEELVKVLKDENAVAVLDDINQLEAALPQ